MADIKWIKLKTAMFNDDKIKVIQAMPEGDALIVIWIRMLILAGISNAEGYLMISDNIPYTEDMLATVFSKPLSVIRLAIKTFEAFGMVEASGEGIFVQDFTEEQSGKLQDIREYNRIKKAESRERAKKKLLEMSNKKDVDGQGYVNDRSMTDKETETNLSLTCQGQMSTCQSTDIDIEKDINKSIINNTHQNPADSGRLDYERISALYNATCKDLPKIKGMSEERRKKVRTLMNALDKSKVLMELGTYERLEYIFRLADESDFLSGRERPNSWCGFDWLINHKNALKVIEGNYKNNGGVNCGNANTGGFHPEYAGYSSESENDALAVFRANRRSDKPEI